MSPTTIGRVCPSCAPDGHDQEQGILSRHSRCPCLSKLRRPMYDPMRRRVKYMPACMPGRGARSATWRAEAGPVCVPGPRRSRATRARPDVWPEAAGSTWPAVISSARAFNFVYGGPSYLLATTSISTLYLQDLLQTCTIVSAGWGLCSRHASAHVAVRRRPARAQSTYHVTGPISLSHLRSSSCNQMGRGACHRRAQGRARAPCTR